MASCSLHPLPYQADPTARFARIAFVPGAVLLDSGRPVAERGRFDLISAWPVEMLTPQADESGLAFFARLRQALADLGAAELPEGSELPFAGGLIGYLGYDFGRRLERLPSLAQADLRLPDAGLGLYAWALINDHQQRTSQLVFHPALPDNGRRRLIELFESDDEEPADAFQLTEPFQPQLSESVYQQAIER